MWGAIICRLIWELKGVCFHFKLLVDLDLKKTPRWFILLDPLGVGGRGGLGFRFFTFGETVFSVQLKGFPF